MGQAERKVLPSTLRPDLVNASVGSLILLCTFRELRRRFPEFFKEVPKW